MHLFGIIMALCYTFECLKSAENEAKTMSSLRKENSEPSDLLVESGQRFYNEHLRVLLEPKHDGEFVAIEPETGRYFLGATGLAALRAGRSVAPDKLFYLLRVGHESAYRVGSYDGARKR